MNVLASVAGQGIKCTRAPQLFTRALQHIWASIRDSRGRGGAGWRDDDDDDITMSHGARRGHLRPNDGPRAKVCLPGFLASGFLVHHFFFPRLRYVRARLHLKPCRWLRHGCLQRRRTEGFWQGLCMYCAQSGHFLASCPVKGKAHR